VSPTYRTNNLSNLSSKSGWFFYLFSKVDQSNLDDLSDDLVDLVKPGET
jgi:hypothetical protein